MPKTVRKHTLASNAQLKNEHRRKRMQLAVRNSGIGSREWMTVIQHALLQIYLQGGVIQTAPEPYPIPLVDDLISNERFIRDFLKAETCEHIEHERLIDLYFMVMEPHIYRHFDR